MGIRNEANRQVQMAIKVERDNTLKCYAGLS
jgi:hypothetical protein